jgi:hypothetical protein
MVHSSRSSLSIILAIGLLASSAGAGAAQAADDGSTEPVPFTVDFIPSDQVRQAAVTFRDGVTTELGTCWAPIVQSPSDPRLAGELTFCTDWHRFGASDQSPAVGMGTYRLVNDEGAWQGSSPWAEWIDPGSGETTGTSGSGGAVILAGDGAYEGLSAVLTFHPNWSDIRGLIFEGDPPAAPVPPTE